MEGSSSHEEEVEPEVKAEKVEPEVKAEKVEPEVKAEKVEPAEVKDEPEGEEELQSKKGGSGQEFLSEVLEAVRLTRQPTPSMVRREKLVRVMKHKMERVLARPGSFVAESLRYNQNLARAYLRFGLPSCPTKDELAVRENRLLRRNKMMLMQLRQEES